MSKDLLNLNLRVWRQSDTNAQGEFHDYRLDGVSTHMSFLEMMDVLNEKLITEGEEPVAFDHDCREGICGSCSMMINGQAHGPDMRQPLVSCTCDGLKMATLSLSSLGEHPLFLYCETLLLIERPSIELFNPAATYR